MPEAQIQKIRIGAKPRSGSYFMIAPGAASVLVHVPHPQGPQESWLPTNAVSAASNLSEDERYEQRGTYLA